MRQDPLASRRPLKRPLLVRLGLWLADAAILDLLWRAETEAMQRGVQAAEAGAPARLKRAYLAGFTDGVVSALAEPGEPSTTARAPATVARMELDQCFRDADFDLTHTGQSLKHTLRPGETAADDHEPHDACAPGYDVPGCDFNEPSHDPLELAGPQLSLSQQIQQAAEEVAAQRDPLAHAEPVFSRNRQARAIQEMEACPVARSFLEDGVVAPSPTSALDIHPADLDIGRG